MKEVCREFCCLHFSRDKIYSKKHNKPKKLFIKWKDLFAEQTWKGLETAGAPMEEMKS